ncbi:hypothetical protein GCM10025777_16420 [Membranihabitans marinus]
MSTEFFLPYFSEITLEDNIKVVLREGPRTVWAEGSANIIDQLDLLVTGNHLVIRTRQCIQYAEDLLLFITVPNLRALNLYGSGIIYSENTLSNHFLDIELLGSGSIDLAVDAVKVDLSMNGSGLVRLEGTSSKLNLWSNGSGQFQGFGLGVNSADVVQNGSGDLYIKVFDILDVEIVGSGVVFFRGFPYIISSIFGSGLLIDSN